MIATKSKKRVVVSCEADLVIPYGSVFNVPIILKQNGEVIEYTNDLLFMVKRSLDDDDDDAIISKTLEVVNTDGDPYHFLIEFDDIDTTNDVGNYVYGFKTEIGDEWLPTSNGTAEITKVVVQGETA